MKNSFYILHFTFYIFFILACSGENPVKKSSPNILFIAVDDLRPALGCYGDSISQTPNIDALAEDGIVFGNAHVQQAVCNPSRASLLTGLRPDALKVWDLQTDFRDTRPEVVTLPQHFKHNGYHSVAIGKIYHNTIPDSASWSEDKLHIDGYPFDPDAVYRAPENVAWLENRKKEIIAAGNQHRRIDQLGQWYLKAVATEVVDMPDDVYYDGAQTDVAVKKLSALKDRSEPFFFAVGYYRPHLPFNAPQKYWDMYDRDEIPLPDNQYIPKNSPLMAMNNNRELRGYQDFKHLKHAKDGPLSEAEVRLLRHGYYASVSYIDAQVGRLMAELERLGLRENTIVVLWGDHGWKIGDHASWGKMTNYEIDTRAPLIISAPGRQDNGSKIDQLVEFVDIYPTLCELAGLQEPPGMEGISLLPLMENHYQPWKTAVFSQFLREGIWIAPDGRVYMGYSVLDTQYHYVEWMDWQTKEYVAYELYDHMGDPQENNNVIDDDAYKMPRQKMAAKLKAGWKAALPPKL